MRKAGKLRDKIFFGVVVALIVILTAMLGVAIVTYEPDNIYRVEGSDNSGNGANEIFVTRGGISYMYTDNFYFITNDRKSHAHSDMTIYRPVAPEGWYIIGDYCQPSYDWPTKSGIVVRADKEYRPDMPVMAPPKDWELVWADHGSGATRDTSIWKPIPPDYYVAIGYVAVQGYNKPVIPEYRCVLNDNKFISYSPTVVTWSTDGSPAKSKVTIYSGYGKDYRGSLPDNIDTSTFIAFSPAFTITAEPPIAPCLRR